MSTFLDIETNGGNRLQPAPEIQFRQTGRWKVSVFALVRGLNDGWLLVQQRSHGRWNFPGGHVQPRESFLAALRREFREKVGILLTGTPRLQTVIEQPDRARLFLYFRASVNPFHQPDCTHNQEISAAASFAPSEFPANRCLAFRLWLQAGQHCSNRKPRWLTNMRRKQSPALKQ